MKPKNLIMPVLALLVSASLHAQTAEDIVAKHLDAIGGKDKIAQIKSLYMETSSQIMGNDAPGTTTILNGKGFRTEVEFNGNKMIQCVSDKGGWSVNPMNGGTAEAMPDEQYKSIKDQISIGGDLVNYADKGIKISLVGKSADGYQLKLTSPDSTETSYYIDPATYYISKMVKKGDMMGQEVEVTTTYSNYQKTDFGYVVPFQVDIDFGGAFSMTTTVKKVEVNKAVDPTLFDMPK
ncbi:MAG TPA: hypothetical protein VG870_10865 [Chitinophagaceae bacterium]|nr:hypothetical protein [Chitinophagaceae bacterium]